MRIPPSTVARFPGSRTPAALLAVAGWVLWLILPWAGCATVGRDFPVERVGEIRLHESTQEQVRSLFGEPWRVGIEDGLRTWTYGKYRYKLFGQASTQDLVLRFDAQGRVASYTFNTTEHNE